MAWEAGRALALEKWRFGGLQEVLWEEPLHKSEG